MKCRCLAGLLRRLKHGFRRHALIPGQFFRAVSPAGVIEGRLSARGINHVVKKLAASAGLDPASFGAHSLRSGFVTEAGRRGVSRNEAMAMTGHKSGAAFDAYFQEGQIVRSNDARLTD